MTRYAVFKKGIFLNDFPSRTEALIAVDDAILAAARLYQLATKIEVPQAVMEIMREAFEIREMDLTEGED